MALYRREHSSHRAVVSGLGVELSSCIQLHVA
eukprot:COSAG04_NODE_15640_length_525_cov_1.100939_1_plen_31_part_10